MSCCANSRVWSPWDKHFWVKLFKQRFLSWSVCVHKSYSVQELVHINWHELRMKNCFVYRVRQSSPPRYSLIQNSLCKLDTSYTVVKNFKVTVHFRKPKQCDVRFPLWTACPHWVLGELGRPPLPGWSQCLVTTVLSPTCRSGNSMRRS